MSTHMGSGAATLASSLTAKIRSDIIEGCFQPGERLRASALSQRYNTSLVPIREALSRLASTGFVIAEDRRGFRVAGVSEAELLDISDVRLFIESEALRRSIADGDIEWESRLLASHHHLKRINMSTVGQSGFNTDWERAHDKFHAALLSGCRSETLLRLADTLRDQTSRYRHMSMFRFGNGLDSTDAPRDVAAEHESLMKTALDRDADAAVRLLTAHFKTTTQMVVKHVIKSSAHETAEAQGTAEI